MGNIQTYLEDLAYVHFYPWLNPRRYANKSHFVSTGGLKVMVEVYAALHQQPWSKRLHELQHMEGAIISAMWNLCETVELRRSIVRCGGLDLCMKSLLRLKLESLDRANQHQFNSWVLVQTLQGATGLLCK